MVTIKEGPTHILLKVMAYTLRFKTSKKEKFVDNLGKKPIHLYLYAQRAIVKVFTHLTTQPTRSNYEIRQFSFNLRRFPDTI